ncbi:hypothetical protein ACTFIU_008518 [Dictyostelium citrinum]
MSTNNSTESYKFPPPPENLINYSNNDINLNKQNNSTTTTTTTTTSKNNNMRSLPPTPSQSNYNNYNTNNNNYNNNNNNNNYNSGNNPTYAQIPQQPIPIQQDSYYEQPPPGYHGENPQVSSVDTFLSKGKVYTDQTKTKIIELNEQYKVTETVKKTAHDAKPKIISGFNFMKTKINDLIDGKGTRNGGGPELNPAMVTSNKNPQQYYPSQQPQQPQYYQQQPQSQPQYYQQQQQQQQQQQYYQPQQSQQFNQGLQQQQQTPILQKQYKSPISEPRNSENYSVEQK